MITWVLLQKSSSIPTYFDKKHTQNYTFSETPILKTWRNVILATKVNVHFLPKLQPFLQQAQNWKHY